MTLPKFITFTGADDATDVDGMLELSSRYPIEWGILLSPKRHGTPRYPSLDKVRAFAYSMCGQKRFPYRMSAHFCGDYSRALLDPNRSMTVAPSLSDRQINDPIGDLLLTAQRAQVNTSDPIGIEAASRLYAWGRSWAGRIILQSRRADCFPAWTEIDWLYDCSGGNGISAYEWPEEPTDRLVGYAGGIGPHNISQVLETAGYRATNYWLDMESGVRTDDRFDLEKCRQVCEAVYGNGQVSQAA